MEDHKKEIINDDDEEDLVIVNNFANNSLIDLIGVKKFRQLATKQTQAFESGLKALEQINDDVLRYLCTFYRNTSDNNRFEVRSSLYLIKQLLTQSLEEFKQNMNETNCLNNTIENQLVVSNSEYLKIKNELNLINNTAKQWNTLTCELTSTNMQFELNKKLQDKIIENLNSKNIKLKEKINELQKKLDSTSNTDEMKKTTSQQEPHEQYLFKDNEEFTKLKESYEKLKCDRKRLKQEKLELLNQTKELYKTIEAKENEIRDFLRHYESKTRETANSVKRIIESKGEIEKEKIQLHTHNQSLIDQNNQMKFLIESKEATIRKLQKQIAELRTKHPRYSYGKESDYGYVSGKSRDTLCNSSTIDTISNIKSTTTLSTSCHNQLSTNESLLEQNKENKTEICSRDSIISTDYLVSNEEKKELEDVNDFTNSNKNLNTSPTSSTSSYSSSNDDSKELHASLTNSIMQQQQQQQQQQQHNNIINSTKQAHVMSISLHIPKQVQDLSKQKSSDSITSSVSSSTSSVMFTNSFCSTADPAHNNNTATRQCLNTLSFDKIPVDQWQYGSIKEWLEYIGMFPVHIKNCLKCVKNGKELLNLSENELEKVFFISNHMHKRKIKLALDDLKAPEKCKFKKLRFLTNKIICNDWLNSIGLKQYQAIFKTNSVDGRVLSTLQRKDLDKYFGVHKRIHQTSILTAIELLKKYEFDYENFKTIRFESETKDISLWSNDSFHDWLKLVSLESYADNLSESGLHGAFVADSSFNIDALYEALRVDEIKHHHIRKIIEDEIKLLKKSKFLKPNSTFIRSMSSFKTDQRKTFTFRGSLGRALGKKIKRDVISSPLIDEDTFKRIENSHKIIDIRKNFNVSSAV